MSLKRTHLSREFEQVSRKINKESRFLGDKIQSALKQKTDEFIPPTKAKELRRGFGAQLATSPKKPAVPPCSGLRGDCDDKLPRVGHLSSRLNGSKTTTRPLSYATAPAARAALSATTFPEPCTSEVDSACSARLITSVTMSTGS